MATGGASGVGMGPGYPSRGQIVGPEGDPAVLNWKAQKALHGVKPSVNDIEEYKVTTSLQKNPGTFYSNGARKKTTDGVHLTQVQRSPAQWLKTFEKVVFGHYKAALTSSGGTSLDELPMDLLLRLLDSVCDMPT